MAFLFICVWSQTLHLCWGTSPLHSLATFWTIIASSLHKTSAFSDTWDLLIPPPFVLHMPCTDLWLNNVPFTEGSYSGHGSLASDFSDSEGVHSDLNDHIGEASDTQFLVPRPPSSPLPLSHPFLSITQHGSTSAASVLLPPYRPSSCA